MAPQQKKPTDIFTRQKTDILTRLRQRENLLPFDRNVSFVLLSLHLFPIGAIRFFGRSDHYGKLSRHSTIFERKVSA